MPTESPAAGEHRYRVVMAMHTQPPSEESLARVASQLHMNTDVRKRIFTAMMGSEVSCTQTNVFSLCLALEVDPCKSSHA